MSGNRGITRKALIPLPANRCIPDFAVFPAFYACYHIAADWGASPEGDLVLGLDYAADRAVTLYIDIYSHN